MMKYLALQHTDIFIWMQGCVRTRWGGEGQKILMLTFKPNLAIKAIISAVYANRRVSFSLSSWDEPIVHSQRRSSVGAAHLLLKRVRNWWQSNVEIVFPHFRSSFPRHLCIILAESCFEFEKAIRGSVWSLVDAAVVMNSLMWSADGCRVRRTQEGSYVAWD